MPGLFVAAELILTCYLIESPWIIIFGSDRQVENADERVHANPGLENDGVDPQSRMKSHKKRFADSSCNMNPHM